MTGQQHEAIVELLRSFPEFTPRALREAGLLDVPHGRIRVLSGDLGEAQPSELRADLALSVAARLSLIVEAQLSIDPAKRRAWPGYVVGGYRRWGHPTALVVVTTSARVERWASRPIEVGPGFVLRPLVIGPAVLPPITSAQEALENPARAVFSALIHGRGPRGFAVGRAAAEACVQLDIPQKDVYFDLIFASLHTVAKQMLEKLMIQNYEFQSEFYRSRIAEAKRIAAAEALQQGLEQGLERGLVQGLEQGLERGRCAEAASAVLRVLSARGLEADAAQRARVLGCGDLATLERWIAGAATAGTVDEALSP